MKQEHTKDPNKALENLQVELHAPNGATTQGTLTPNGVKTILEALGKRLKCCKPGSTKALVRIVPDQTYPGMWRVLKDGSLSDMTSLVSYFIGGLSRTPLRRKTSLQAVRCGLGWPSSIS
jgi:hypothetical protein